jgi:hypothetical protein
MKYLKSVALVTALGLSTLATGCATITGGTHQDVSVRTQKDSVDVAGANCVLTNSEGTWTVTTPGKANVHRARGDLSVTCTKPGESDAVATVSSKTRAGAVAGDVAWLGVLSVVTYGVDRANGSVFTYPDDITVSFGGQAQSQSPDAQKAKAAPEVAPADSSASNDTSATLTK